MNKILTQSTTKINSDNPNTSSENISQHVGAINLNEKEIKESAEKQINPGINSNNNSVRNYREVRRYYNI